MRDSERLFKNYASASLMESIRYYSIEFVRRIVQIFFGMNLFDFHGLIQIRQFFYRLVFRIGGDIHIGGRTFFTRDHRMITGEFLAGKSVYIGDSVHIDFSGGIVLEDYVSIAEGALILTHTHPIVGDVGELLYFRKKRDIIPTPITLKKSCWIGAKAIILPGVAEIGENAIITAGSVVSQSVPANSIVRGNPARVVTKYR